jgi:nucleotide-binding universal stress UspA family protein
MTVGTVLCGVDHSDGAMQALRVAADLCARLDLRLVVVYVVDQPAPFEAVAPVVVRAAEQALGRLVLEAEAERRVEIRVAVGLAAQRLVEIDDDEGAQMIIIGSRPARRWPRLGGGRLATMLARTSTSAILVVPAVADAAVGRRDIAPRVTPPDRETRQRIPILGPAPPLGESRRDACSSPDSHRSGIVSWRREQLLQAGLPLAVAASVALIPHYEVHEVLSLIRRGCPPELAVRILAPLDGQAASNGYRNKPKSADLT